MQAFELGPFREAVSGEDGQIELMRAALLFARSAYPSLDVQRYLDVVAVMADEACARLEGCHAPRERLERFNAFFFHHRGFTGNARDYADPRNSFLNEVIDRRLGIPISLSVLYVEIGRQAGLPLAGLSFPGHFLVRLSVPEGVIVLDPFFGGLSLSRLDLERRLQGLCGPDGEPPGIEQWLQPAANRTILSRMLRNLKGLYMQRGEHLQALGIIDHMLCIEPEDPEEIRDRGLLLQRLECPRAARDAFLRYLDLSPDAEDAAEVRARYVDSLRGAPKLH